jgi:hypothetical protein
VREFINCIDMKVEQSPKTMSAKGFRVVLHLKNGNSFEAEAEMPWGPENPPQKDELIKKFNSLTEGILSSKEKSEWNSIYREGIEKDGSFDYVVSLLERNYGTIL